jgi:UDP-N-acetylmuramoyl-tripeptide--D-alanyl-D-alanine ligase
MNLTAAQILSATSGSLAAGEAATAVTGLSTDSRTTKPGDVFFALIGERFDGHNFLRQAATAKAAAIVISSGAVSDQLTEFTGPVIVVADTQRALGDLAAWYRGRFEGTVVAITGSCGKTTVKEMLGQILAAHLRGQRPQSSFNNSVGVPLTILRSEPDDDFLVLELGTNAPGEMRRLAEIARPDLAVVTCVGPSHLEGLRSLEGVAEEKEHLVRALGADGVAVLNFDDERVRAMGEATRGRVVTFGTTGGDVRAERIEVGPDGVRFALETGVEIRLPAPGRHNVLNALAAVTAARQFGLADDAIAAALTQYRSPKMRLARTVLGEGVTLIDDAYNANPMSSGAALEVLCLQPKTGRYVLVQGDMLELGAESERRHEELGRAIAASCVGLLVTVGPLTRATSLAAAERGDLVRFHFGDSQAASGEVVELLAPGDVVLVKGSRGLAMEHVVAAIKEKFGALAPARES